MLAVSGDIDYAGSGPSVEASSLRRSVFRKAMRNSPDAFLARFDAPDGSSSTAKRASTTTSVQALLLINSSWTIERAERLAKRVKEVGRGLVSKSPISIEKPLDASHRIKNKRLDSIS